MTSHSLFFTDKLWITTIYPKNNAMFAKYQEEAEKNDKVIFCGRLADYKYYDMHVVIERALEVVEKEFTK